MDVPFDGSSIYAAWRVQHLRRLAGSVFMPLGETNIYAAWRIPKPKTRTKKAPPPVGEGFGERVEKNRAATKPIS